MLTNFQTSFNVRHSVNLPKLSVIDRAIHLKRVILVKYLANSLQWTQYKFSASRCIVASMLGPTCFRPN